MSRLAHPGYFAFIPASSTFAGALGDLIAARARHRCGLMDVRRRTEPARAGRARLVQELDRISAEAEGVLVSGGSAANITALACARESLVGAGSDRAVAYVADQTHSSVARAARLIGFRPDQLRVLPTDDAHRLRARCARRGGRRGQRRPASSP